MEKNTITENINEGVVEETQQLFKLPNPKDEWRKLLSETIEKYEAAGFVLKRKYEDAAVMIKPKSDKAKKFSQNLFLIGLVLIVCGVIVSLISNPINLLLISVVGEFGGFYLVALIYNIFFSNKKVKLFIQERGTILETGETLEKIKKTEERKVRGKKSLPYLWGILGGCILFLFIMQAIR